MAETQINLEIFLRAYMDLRKSKTWDSEKHKRFWMDVVEFFLEGKNKDLKFEYDIDNMPTSVKNLIDVMQSPYGKGRVAEIKDVVNFVAQDVFYPEYDKGNRYDNVPQLQMFLKRLSEFNDKNLVYDALKFLKNIVGYRRADIKWLDEKRKIVCNEIVNMIASNPNATQEDIVELIYWAKTPDEVLKVINDVFAKTDKDLSVEMKKDVPSAQTVNNIIYYPKEVVSIALGNNDASLELKEYIDRFREQNIRFVKNPEDIKKFREFVAKVGAFRTVANDKYNFDRIVGSGDRNYVSNYEETVDNKNVELEKENQRLSDENQHLVQTNKDLQQHNDEKKAEHVAQKAKWEQRYVDERAARLSVEKMLQNALKVIEAYENGEAAIGKAGVFNKGAEKIKMMKNVENAKDELKRAEAEEKRRMAELVARQKSTGEAISI